MHVAAKNGDEVEVIYVGKLKDQTIFDSTDEKKPFKFVIGSENILKSFSDAIVGMKVGDKKTIELSSESAYGAYNQDLVAKITKSSIPANAQVGDVLTDSNNNNWWIHQINDDSVIINGNHPLAGQTLIFDIELLRIN